MASSSIKTIDAYSVSIHFEVVLIYNLGSHSREQIYWENSVCLQNKSLDELYKINIKCIHSKSSLYDV